MLSLLFSAAGHAFVIAVLTFAFRAGLRVLHDPGLWRKSFPLEGYQGDAMTHLLMVEMIRRRGCIPEKVPQFRLTDPNDYPMFFHLLHAWIPRRVLERYEWVVSPFYEALHIGLLFLLTEYLARTFMPGIPSVPAAYLATVGMAMTPLLLHAPGRYAAFGERTFGFLHANGFLITLALYGTTGRWGWALAAVGFFCVTAVSSKFGIQACTFIACAVALIHWDPMPVALLLVSFPAAAFFSGGYSLRVLQGLIRHSMAYQSWFVHVQDYTKSISLRSVVRAANLAGRGLLREAVRTARQHPLGNVPWLVPWLFVFVPALLMRASWWPPEPASTLVGWLVDVTVASWLVAAVIMLDRLRFLGEAERYLEYGLYPMMVTVAFAVLGQGGLWAALYGVLLLGCAVQGAVSLTRARAPRGDRGLAETTTFLRTLPSGTFAGIPGRLAFPICYGTDHMAFWCLTNIPRHPLQEVFKGLFGAPPHGTYPFIHPDVLHRSSEAFGIDFVVVWKAALDGIKQAFGLEYDFAGMPVLFENESYLVVRTAKGG